MAKTPKSKTKDKHTSGFMLRLPGAYRAPMAALKAKNRRPMTTELQLALDKHFKDEGIAPPATSN